jgi:hypothetical protein
LISTRYTRHSPRYATRSGCAAHQRLRARVPLLRAAHVVSFEARRDNAAVDGPGNDRRHLAGSHRDHRFVEKHRAARSFSEANERASLAHPREAREVGITETVANRRGLAEGGLCRGNVTVDEELKCLRHEQISTLDAVVATVV